jgi:hypothetical protein
MAEGDATPGPEFFRHKETTLSVPTILSETPPWVWVLLVYLLWRGVRALRPREVGIGRMLILPLIFLGWGLYAIFSDQPDWPVALTAFVVTLGLGIGAGWLENLRLPPARYVAGSRRIRRPGTATTLVLIVASFLSKYALSVALAIHPGLGAQVGFATLSGGVPGLIDGLFWGGRLCQLRQASRAQAIIPEH